MLRDLCILKRMFSFIGKQKWIYVISLIGIGVSGGIRAALLTLLYKNTFDASVETNLFHFRSVIVLTLILVGVSLLQRMFSFLFSRTARIIQGNLRKVTFSKLGRMTMESFESNHSGEILSCMNNDIKAMEQAYTRKMQNLINTFISGSIALIIMLALDIKIALISTILSIISTLVNTRFIPLLRGRAKSMLEHMTGMTKILSDATAGNATIKAFNLNQLFFSKFVALNASWKKENIRQIKANSYIGGIQLVLQVGNFVIVLITGVYFILRGSVTIGTVVGIMLQQDMVGYMFQCIGDFANDLQQAFSGAERVFRFLDNDEERSHISESFETATEEVKLQNITFNYHEEQTVLKDVSMSIERNKVIGIVGPSGSGKSTIFKFLMEFYPVKSGKIYIHSRSIGHYNLTTLREIIAYVPQDAFLYSGTIKENIAMGKSNASDEEIISAAKKAFAHEFIMRLPETYDTKVGELGTQLSGGERQRIAIARAILRNAPILLLDEITSALDTISEHLIQQAIESLRENHTILIIAHRLSTISHADIIYVMDKGEITEKGNHDELLKSNGLYSRLFNVMH